MTGSDSDETPTPALPFSLKRNLLIYMRLLQIAWRLNPMLLKK